MTDVMDKTTVRDAAGVWAGLAKDGVLWGADSAKAHASHHARKLGKRIVKTRAAKKVTAQVDKLNEFVQQPKVVKVATTALGIETILGFFGCIGTSTMMFATGNPVFGVGVIFMYIFGVCVRYITAVNALHVEVA